MEHRPRPGGGHTAVAPLDATAAEVLDGLFEATPSGLAVYDTDLRLVRMNAALERILGAPAVTALGRRMDEVFPSGEGERMVARLAAVLRTGIPVLTTEHRGRTAADPARDHVWAISSFRLAAADGRILGVASSIVDVTEVDHTRERLLTLKQAAERIGSTLDVIGTAEELAEVAVPRLADFVAVDLLDGVAEGAPPPRGPVPGTAVLRRAAVRSVTENAPESAVPVGTVTTYPPDTPYARCLSSGESLLLPVLDRAADWLAQGGERAAKILRVGAHTLMTVPLKARDVTLGLAHFYRWELPEPFDGEDLALAEDLVSRAAVCIDNARRYTEEHRATLTLQRSLLLRGSIPVPGLMETAHRYVPARAHAGAAGDWFDVVPLSGARVGLVVGDVVGRGIEAVARAGRLRTAIRTLASLDLPPDELLSRLDALARRQIDAPSVAGSADESVGPGLSGTCLYLVHDRVTGQCTMASAGHPPPIVVREGRGAELVPLQPGPPLGLGTLPFEATEMQLPEDAVLALWTDGLVGARDQDPDAAVARLLGALASPAGSLDELCGTAFAAALATRRPDDDAILLLARPQRLPSDQVATWELPVDPAVVARARDEVSLRLASWGLADEGMVTELIVSELVTNAIRYGKEPILLRLIRDGGELISEVFDRSSTSPHLRRAADTDEGGRGLFMVAQLADAWGTRYAPRGKTIWAKQALPAPQ
ncbi:SpoIIE family protein phosphatase [Streptacidiphilus jiangxiensis]|uniref:PAS domain S-box-containing protein n=1 Tax=Streptacidiphilus jiangxiensis TaxID=235985 RepID=A0A1H7QU38_STRJI|nr:SpoIIE family protein phosphatase [Streptacidiphilus jiangxiensis]SEL51399.1 PAS domain S-box-containing protein [Streptacidiphilus jiangxiensis]